MKAKINTTGTHVQKGILKVRIDLYPDPGDKTYARHYVDKYDREPTEEELADQEKQVLIPTHPELNPCLCHFIKVDEGIAHAGLETLLVEIFDAGTRKVLDDALADIEITSNQRAVSRIMASKGGIAPSIRSRVEDTVAAVNSRLKDFEVQL
jgi:hypothetical protein